MGVYQPTNRTLEPQRRDIDVMKMTRMKEQWRRIAWIPKGNGRHGVDLDGSHDSARHTPQEGNWTPDESLWGNEHSSRSLEGEWGYSWKHFAIFGPFGGFLKWKGTPIAGWCIVENHPLKMYVLGVPPLKKYIYIYIYNHYISHDIPVIFLLYTLWKNIYSI